MIKKAVISGLAAGIVYSLIMAAFDYGEDKAFNMGKLVIDFFWFGIFMGVFNYFTLIRRNKK